MPNTKARQLVLVPLDDLRPNPANPKGHAGELCWRTKGMPGTPARRFKNEHEPVYQFSRGEWKFRPAEVRVWSENAVAFRPGRGSNAGTQGTPKLDILADGRGPGLVYPSNLLPTFAGSHEAVGHGAAFPVGLPRWFALAYSDAGDVLFDPFTGSGSTILAAHETDRVGRGLELSPAYADVAVARIQRQTGLVPHRNGKPVDVLAHVLADPAATRVDPGTVPE